MKLSKHIHAPRRMILHWSGLVPECFYDDFSSSTILGTNVLALHKSNMTFKLTCCHIKHIHAPQRMNHIILDIQQPVLLHHFQDQLLTHTQCYGNIFSILIILRGWTPLLLYWPHKASWNTVQSTLLFVHTTFCFWATKTTFICIWFPLLLPGNTVKTQIWVCFKEINLLHLCSVCHWVVYYPKWFQQWSSPERSVILFKVIEHFICPNIWIDARWCVRELGMKMAGR